MRAFRVHERKKLVRSHVKLPAESKFLTQCSHAASVDAYYSVKLLSFLQNSYPSPCDLYFRVTWADPKLGVVWRRRGR